ncbi:YbaK/EbsC family protein [Heliophilum fasciatum]|uniref:Prolyl-tRNA editing enzyme YbaK/EbsC (Cys-tRNA(Pro) deacylase) n=1 Tax=Heliophilum fasciatum TaxID=35700 RepID=A0A4V2SY86_9FIRM|nr:YbaK/EbsC family protein [Heliophilum fasciatum]MCW2276601.1 prolyl-tRNA editing enzyme YbaK/EbsC (Cys-tRNA(Pro) deacylase) [Heliophilum fasciatum]TCP69016.1 prolyl-tRNA editing enzyme YbaK/EbsC (Cys-tRNA(Pro) deacylase) [Heliophilum fasciatum]
MSVCTVNENSEAFQRVMAYLAPFNLGLTPKLFDVSTASAELAAQAVGVPVGAIAKTICFEVKGHPVLVVTSGDVRVDQKKLKTLAGGKAKFVQPEKALELTGYPAGGVCPFALPSTVRIFIDESLQRFPVVYVAAGTANSALPITVEQLQVTTGGEVADLTEWHSTEGLI